MILRPENIQEITVPMRRFMTEIILISLDSSLADLTNNSPQLTINLCRALSILLGVFTSIKDKVYLFFKKQRERFNYSPLSHLEELLKGISYSNHPLVNRTKPGIG